MNKNIIIVGLIIILIVIVYYGIQIIDNDEPEPDIHPPAPEPDIHPPAPEPDIHPPAPEPDIHPPAPEPDIHPPAPEPDIHPPAPEPNEYVKLIKCGEPPNLNYVFKNNVNTIDPQTGSLYFYQQLSNDNFFISIEFDESVFGVEVTSKGYYSALYKCEHVINNTHQDGSVTKGNFVYKLEKATKGEFDKWLAGNRG